MKAVVGVDFDNTIVTYDALMARLAVEEGWLQEGEGTHKREIRDALRRLTDGELKWRRLQYLAYGHRIREAHLVEGVLDFFARCDAESVPVYVVSHKTRYSELDPERTDLREAALGWLADAGIVPTLPPAHVFFEDDRTAKVTRIAGLGCTHFVDDLEETFLEPSFPPSADRLLFRPDGEPAADPGIRVFRSWSEITAHVFAER